MQFNFTNDRPIYLQLIEQLELYIISGRIPPGARLPAVRELALRAKVNPNTIQRALTELESKKLIHTERTNGKFVTQNTKHLLKYRDKIAKAKVKTFLNDMQELGLSSQEAINYLKIKEV